MINKLLCWLGFHRMKKGGYISVGKRLDYCKRSHCTHGKTVTDDEGYYKYIIKLRESSIKFKPQSHY